MRQRKIGVIIISVVSCTDNALNYTDVRSVFSAEMRLKQTIKTVESVREKIPDADIYWIEGGLWDVHDFVAEKVNNYIYLGGDSRVRRAVDSKHKGLGEVELCLKSLDMMKDYDFLFKISGRYYLSEKFEVNKFNYDMLNFKCYAQNGSIPSGVEKYISGSYSTRLYGIPQKNYTLYRSALKKSKVRLRLGHSLEGLLCRYMQRERFYYIDELGVSGIIGIDREKKIFSE